MLIRKYGIQRGLLIVRVYRLGVQEGRELREISVIMGVKCVTRSSQTLI